MRILSGDPGKVNFALTVLDVKGKRLDIMGTRMFGSPIQNLTGDLGSVTKKFIDEIAKIDKQYGPFDAMCFERFQSRGLGGNTIEAISIMIGVMAFYCHKKKIPFFAITASQWKNAFNRHADLKGLYKEFNLTSKKSKKAIHEFDSMLIGIYTFYKLNELTPFAGIQKMIYPIIDRFLNSPKL
ncbi:Holliday junction resolvase [Dickeya phage vB_DsoM_JA29]|uniref:Putative holliday junction resolvase n=1 Tax=Dickeya phage vB_DsoM_JA29 TaxID=2283031 RepID=A0A384ZXG6_9CAUD|nr:Holliday junction resolvase [Dickeya phage vB_DsoM_JA29]AXG66931.1 putative holliday junction resolvase [Dickeya phage vB_DsoM_JA29]